MPKGSCLCGAITFEVTAPLPPPGACHCSQCRRMSGHYWAATDIPRDTLILHGEASLSWYSSSPTARRGFCSACGSSLFWDKAGWDRIAVAMGAFDQPTDSRLERHIFVGNKGDYYDIADGLPQDFGTPVSAA